MITKISTLPEESEEDKAIKSLIEEFNTEAINQKSKYRVILSYGYPHLIKLIFLHLGNSIGNYQICYRNINKNFTFIGGIDKPIFEDIKSILKVISSKFDIELTA